MKSNSIILYSMPTIIFNQKFHSLHDSNLNDSPPGVAICSSASHSCREKSSQHTIKHMLIIMDKSLNIDKYLLLVFPLFFLTLIFFGVKITMLTFSRLDKDLFFLLELLDERHLGTQIITFLTRFDLILRSFSCISLKELQQNLIINSVNIT